ncbi:hypothetical protein [Streptomyces sp. 1331.2]|uniref:hypothetical protein n=1 Tax=Streptomyces sp. 1331.2 TaxID=1938835 RepID=UPI000BC3A47C|nr:hypothetical protein [Streptomyces sp. 1331.2]SOB84047.1 hypothetical protein SAMN06272789_4279 [Streptomyces sp. 1331.2]
MTSLHPAPTDPSVPGPPGDNAGSSPPPAVSGPTAVPGPVCSIATAAEAGPAAPGPSDGVIRQGCASRHDSVPQPRSKDDAETRGLARTTGAAEPGTGSGAGSGTDAVSAGAAEGLAADGGPTAARLRAAFAERLRAARAQGRSVTELADACRRPVAEVRELLGEEAELPELPALPGVAAEAGGGSGAGNSPGVGFVRFQPSTVPPPVAGPSVPAPRTAREELRPLGSRRPSPSRRLRRMHPQTAPTGQEATARETAATGPTGAGPRSAVTWAGELAGAPGRVADQAPYGAGTGAAAVAPDAEASRAEPPLGILIGGSPGQPEAVGRPEERAPVRVSAEPIRVGRGTSLVVLPSWRPAIAVSVPTEQLLSATGLRYEQLAGSRLTVLMNPSALHDRELDLHGWEPGPTGRARRAGRP